MNEDDNKGRPLWLRLTLLALSGVLVISFVLLGNWQVKRLAWKLDLIEKVNSRAFAEPQTLPKGHVTKEEHAYRRVKLAGQFAHEQTILVKAVTGLGPGFWVMTPLKNETQTIWINRGFVPSKLKFSKQWRKPKTEQTIVGLLRLSEPKGTLLEANNPSKNLWVARDIAAMSLKVGIKKTPLYFIDQQGPLEKAKNINDKVRRNLKSWPRSGLTTVKFNNPHLAYALTWYAMALFLTAAIIFVTRHD